MSNTESDFGTLADLMMMDEAEVVGDGAVTEVLLSLIVPDPDQPRKNIDDERVSSLVPSIKQHGVIQPIIVSPMDDGKYMIIAGERRYQASRLAEKATIPVVIREVSSDDRKAYQLVENLHREDLSPMEEANYISNLVSKNGLNKSQKEVADLLDVSEAWVSLRNSLSKVPDVIKSIADKGVTTDIDTLVKLGKLYEKSRTIAAPFIEDNELINRKAVRQALKDCDSPSATKLDAVKKKKSSPAVSDKSSKNVGSKTESISSSKVTYIVKFNGNAYTLLHDRECEQGYVVVSDPKGNVMTLNCADADVVLLGSA